MDGKLKTGNYLKALMHLTIQNNILLQTQNKLFIQLHSTDDDSFIRNGEVFDELYNETKGEVLAELKESFGKEVDWQQFV